MGTINESSKDDRIEADRTILAYPVDADTHQG